MRNICKSIVPLVIICFAMSNMAAQEQTTVVDGDTLVVNRDVQRSEVYNLVHFTNDTVVDNPYGSPDEIFNAFFPTKIGAQLTYESYDKNGKMNAYFTMTVREREGDLQNGRLMMVYNFYEPDGEPFFRAPNEFIMDITKKNGRSYIVMNDWMKALRVQYMLSSGDPSTIMGDFKVGDRLPDTEMPVKIGFIKATIYTTERQVIDYKTIKTEAGTFNAYLIHESVRTKTPVGTFRSSSDSWYARYVSNISQIVYSSKGVGKSSVILVGYKKGYK
ncbi:MAG: hypothetical protein MJ000_09955 [Bacteroidales bacterium]|nr:hypothetical protein [Bacteroidales bacterium]